MGMHGHLLRVSPDELQRFREIAAPAAEAVGLPPGVTEEEFARRLQVSLPLALAHSKGGNSPERIARLMRNQRFRQRMIALFYGSQGDRKAVGAFLSEREARALNLDKTFHALHWLLTGAVWGGEPPLANAVLGGTEYGPDLGYGRVRYLTAEEVAAVAPALQALAVEVLMQRWDVKALKKDRIYAVADREGRVDCARRYPRLQAYYAEAAGAGEAMLSYIL